MAGKSVLFLTLPPGLGGIAAQNRLAADLLRRHGYSVSLAWRAAYGEAPELSVPAWRALYRRPRAAIKASGRSSAYAVGTWLPEVEWAHHQPWQPWREIIARHQRHVVISGNILPGWGLNRLGLPALHWVATPYQADRVDRARAWPLWRRAYDRLANRWVALAQERSLLQTADSWAISDYTLRSLRAIAPHARVHGIIVIPVDTGQFHPAGRFAERRQGAPVRIGTSGRLSDPRKGLGLLIEAFTRLAAAREDVELHLRGDLSREQIAQRFNIAPIADRLVVQPPVPRARLPEALRQLDIFVLPSHQEGLSQTTAEAMACGCCIVSTRCGGPEEFVLDGRTGLLADIAGESLGQRLLEAVEDEPLRRRLGSDGAELVRQRYAPPIFERQFMTAFAALYPG